MKALSAHGGSGSRRRLRREQRDPSKAGSHHAIVLSSVTCSLCPGQSACQGEQVHLSSNLGLHCRTEAPKPASKSAAADSVSFRSVNCLSRMHATSWKSCSAETTGFLAFWQFQRAARQRARRPGRRLVG